MPSDNLTFQLRSTASVLLSSANRLRRAKGDELVIEALEQHAAELMIMVESIEAGECPPLSKVRDDAEEGR